MKTLTATAVKARFGAALRAAAREPVAITSHGQVVAYLVHPSVLDADLPDLPLDEDLDLGDQPLPPKGSDR